MRRLQTGLVIALTTVGVIQVFLTKPAKMWLLQVARAPVLNDVSTDLDDPPAFIVARHGPLPEQWRPRIRAAYPDVKPLTVRVPTPASASEAAAAAGAGTILDTVTAVARATPLWQVQKVVDGTAAGAGAEAEAAPGVMLLEAVATTRLLKFRDDVVVRVRQEQGQQAEAGSAAAWRVDMRSKSRVGKGDLGANAARIRAFMERLRQELTLRGLTVE
ncbi:hypothetical protein PLESTB_001599200 [Pleodorina starrii]|uniref:DUF1499 domain-containing protein n=1 Tax=Pleodorina starrii TaxID=330485 RepID=A0A9W6F937_9CHLO|nr:hypothetical protein PLESTM_001044200 [Pleodorina starrii]GLC60330.1 hypothetical protein PLESTB_001599200 [Pleodorina starrii]GLC77525.1 hypothetical protein PLESTF_001950800 [Pleodorina starrii]